MARPRADEWLEREINDWKNSGVEVVVSLLESKEISELGLHREAELCRFNGIEFISFPIPDRGLPESHQEAQILAQSLAAGVRDGRSIAVHCRAGIGRSSMIAACALICFGDEAAEAFIKISASRGIGVPDTDEQRDWVAAFGNAWREVVTSIYMPLLNEGTTVWRPVAAERLSENAYRIIGPMPGEEEWAFPPKSLVIGAPKQFADGSSGIVAVRILT